jgi:hypothetical protein
MMTQTNVVVTGWIVMLAKPGAKRPTPISSKFTIREAADQFCALAKKSPANSGADVYVTELHGVEVPATAMPRFRNPR